MGLKGCWTCRARKVRCDLHEPQCHNCTKARRSCSGYGMQLSWPKRGDAKRATYSKVVRTPRRAYRIYDYKYLNTDVDDILLSEQLQAIIPDGSGEIASRTETDNCNDLPRAKWSVNLTFLAPLNFSRQDSYLLEYFTESTPIVLGPNDETNLTQFVVRVALSAATDTSNMVLQGIFALASLQLHGRSRSFRFKHHVVTSFTEPGPDTDTRSLLELLVAMMLLYHYELLRRSNSRSDWQTFFCAVKRIMNESPQAYKLIKSEFSVFLDWVYYNEVMGEFTVRHWSVPYLGCGFAPRARSLLCAEPFDSQHENGIGCPLDVLELITLSCEQGLAPGSARKSSTDGDMDRIMSLESTILKVVGSVRHESLLHADPKTRKSMVVNLHRLACLIYVNRAVHQVSGTEFRHRWLVKDAIWLLTKLETCQHAWPLFIIASEAVEDTHRLAILDVFERTSNDSIRRSNHIALIQPMVEAVWKQHDLNVEDESGHLKIIDTVVHSLPFMPAFA